MKNWIGIFIQRHYLYHMGNKGEQRCLERLAVSAASCWTFDGKYRLTHSSLDWVLKVEAYEIDLTITKVLKKPTNPSELPLSDAINGGYHIVEIKEAAFSNCNKLARLTILDSIVYIERAAFFCCKKLTNVMLGNGITGIEEAVFLGCTGLVDLFIPDNVTDIGDHAFGGCKGIKSVILGNGVTRIGKMAFSECTGLTRLTV